MGPLNVATLVTVGGQYQNFWDADTKLDKDTSTTTYNQVYVKSAAGGQGTINVTKQSIADAVVQRQSDGNIYVPLVPAEGVDAASKEYVDTEIAKQHVQWKPLSCPSDEFVSFDLSSIQVGKTYKLEILRRSGTAGDVYVNSSYGGTQYYDPGYTTVFKDTSNRYTLMGRITLKNATTLGICSYDDGGPLEIYYRFILIE